MVTLPNPLTSLVPEVIVSHQLLGSLLSHRQGLGRAALVLEYSSNPAVETPGAQKLCHCCCMTKHLSRAWQ